jgi:cytochrome P450
MDPSKTYDYWPEVSRLYGDFYTMGIPGIGAGINQTVYIVQDPQEMMKVLKAEGKFPSGAAQTAWALRQIMEDHGHAAAAKIFDQGPEWKRVRTFFQTDLLSPQAAKQYVPSIAEVTQYASQGVTKYDTNDLNTFMEDASFDMFSSLTLGTHTRITDPNFEADPQDVKFCRLVKNGLTGSNVLTQDVTEMMMGRFLGMRTSKYKQVEGYWKEALAIASQKIDVFLKRRKEGIQTEMEKNSYLQQALDRLEVDGAEVTIEECCQIVRGLLGASVE